MSIKIMGYWERIDNWGRTRSSLDSKVIHEILVTPNKWTDDMHFEDIYGETYFIEDLIGKEVFLENIGVITVL